MFLEQYQTICEVHAPKIIYFLLNAAWIPQPHREYLMGQWSARLELIPDPFIESEAFRS